MSICINGQPTSTMSTCKIYAMCQYEMKFQFYVFRILAVLSLLTKLGNNYQPPLTLAHHMVVMKLNILVSIENVHGCLLVDGGMNNL